MLALIHHWYTNIGLGGWTTAWIGFVLIIVVSFLPVLPIPLIAAAVGAKLPLVEAVLVTWTAACAGTLLKFAIERFILQKPVHRVLAGYRYWRSLVYWLQRNGFTAVLITRLIPIFPSSVVNTAGAVTGISVNAFVLATLIGKLPTMIVFTAAGGQILHHFWRTVLWLSAYGVIVGLLAWWVVKKLRRGDGENSQPNSEENSP